MIKSKALEANLTNYQVHVTIKPEYLAIQEALSRYYGIMEGVNAFLVEVSHPYKNWQVIVQEARGYALDYFHLLMKHPKGPEAARLFIQIFGDAFEAASDAGVRADAVDNWLLYLMKILRESGEQIDRFLPVVNTAIDRIAAYPGDRFSFFLKSHYQIRRLVTAYLEATKGLEAVDFGPVGRLAQKYYEQGYAYFLSEQDPLEWFMERSEEESVPSGIEAIFEPIGSKRIADHLEAVRRVGINEAASRRKVQDLSALPAYMDIVESYRGIPAKLLEAGRSTGKGNHWKVLFLFHIMNISGLSMIHEEALRDINRTLSWLIDHESQRNIVSLIKKTFTILESRIGEFPTTALNCILNMGKGVYKTDDRELVNQFVDSVIALGFQTPNLSGVGNDWQIRVNAAHLQNIRTWLGLIQLNPRWSTRLLSTLIIELALFGVFIKDTDLFPRDITALLNSDTGPVYNMVKQLARLFPVFFNDIGAEGELRDISTQLDELTMRKDVLIHFLRKQSHVESSNRILDFMAEVIVFWCTGDKGALEPFVPPNIYQQIQENGSFVDGVRRILSHIAEGGVCLPKGLILEDRKRIDRMIDSAPDAPAMDRERVRLLVSFYRLIDHKYNLDLRETDHYLDQLRQGGFSGIGELKEILRKADPEEKLEGLLDYLDRLKALILSKECYEIREDIYKKRHFAVDIPSMYGSYHELKFDAMGLTFRLESVVNVLFEELVEAIDLSLITKSTLVRIHDQLTHFCQALRVDGIPCVEFERQLEVFSHALDVRGFTFTQYIDLFKAFAVIVKNIINDCFHNAHERNLSQVLQQSAALPLLEKYQSQSCELESDRLHHRISEIFFRDRMATSLGLPQLDRFLTRILNALYQQNAKLEPDQLRMLLRFDPDRVLMPFDCPNERVNSIIYLGNKGFNLVKLMRYGLPIPPGFIITTEVFRCLDIIGSYSPASQNFWDQVRRAIRLLEEQTGLGFGDPENPLLCSVRSGSSISQPGMMDTYLNVGINEAISEGFAKKTGNAWFAWDNYRRYLQCYGMAHGIDRDDFDAIMRQHKELYGIPFKRYFTGDQMRDLALAYKQYLMARDVMIIEDPMEQLRTSIQNVFNSWNSEKAKTYRQIMGISDDWGTAVTVQAMVYGNRSRKSGTGVIFTHNPRWSGGSQRLWGDFAIGNQGEDVVSGLVKTLPISTYQQEIEMRDTDIILEREFPEIYRELNRWAAYLVEEKGWSPQEIEFTFEGSDAGDFHVLQARDMVIRERKPAKTFDVERVRHGDYLGHGIGVSGGAMSGRVVFDLEEIESWRGREPETPLILLRGDTVPDDIKEIHAADGLLTARGGLTSHAAVVAHRLDKTCVVGCGNLECREDEKVCLFNQVEIHSGEYISIDGQEGSVYQGQMVVKAAC